METLSQIFTTLKTITILYINLLLLKLASAIHSLIRRFSGKRIFTTTQFLTYLEEKNPAVLYTKVVKRQRETPPECAVCLSEFAEEENVRDLKCKHVFHKDCLDKWLLQCRSTCPLCRCKVLPDKVVAGYRQFKDDQMEYDRSNEEMVFIVSRLDGNGFLSFWW
ncbi:E3 ubiquitin-protein ligase RHA1B [Hevea brasiliensis]|uniref:E3 ubiquitin-protein ligase RHA1B n=1 Tax=Hevea brasiliensis TaxID=3981 RepID=UPI000B785EA7|nr:E3 ubiquitin-protein ligase RHA1B [Hevea brasiliensis]